jgi:hypothetical protein
VPYAIEVILFLLPFAAYAVWRRFNPAVVEPSSRLLALAIAGVACALAGAVWYGLSRSMDRGAVYVAPRLSGDAIEPGHAEPRRR